ncbi:MAG: tRNA (adenosine(37)-N6)-threonylcarbamoyltransferase complex dimerization subunit type 1 TsaB [Chlorobia bacterium]|nr:tRNA (adenosine(37)-N6)-threonylcarbamoyltransferase complex dimerization subunit type 1 TsaB [Fimbriimonadaceae bacterium]
MIVGFSTSSAWTSVALISPEGEVVASSRVLAPMQASGACMALLDEILKGSGRTLKEATLIAADLGPGSFTGVKVSVTIAKTMAFALGIKATGASSFDLISLTQTVVMPSKRGEFFIRVPGQEPIRQEVLPEGEFVGFGPGIEDEVFPDASRFADLASELKPVQPELLVPNYLIEPSISQPKKPLSPVLERGGA